MVVIENPTIVALTTNEALVQAFPFLAQARNNIARSSGGCGSCGRSAINSVDYNQIKMAIASLPLEAQVKFKQLTGWDQVKVVYSTGSTTQTTIF